MVSKVFDKVKKNKLLMRVKISVYVVSVFDMSTENVSNKC